MSHPPIQIIRLPGQTPYDTALALQQQAVDEVLAGGPERAYFLEHPPVFTTGTSASPAELLATGDIPVLATGRGGKTTYHGPGQRVVYLVLNLDHRGRDIRAYIKSLQSWLIAALADLGISAHTSDDVGVWVGGQGGTAPLDASASLRGAQPPADAEAPNVPAARTKQTMPDHSQAPLTPNAYALMPEAKIAAIGVRVRKWVTFHGIALNVNPDLSAYTRIIPCGLAKPVTSLHALGHPLSMERVDAALITNLSLLSTRHL